MTIRYAPTVPAFLAAVLVLGACGSDGSTTEPAGTGGTLPGVTKTGPLAPYPIRVTGGSASAAGNASLLAESTDSRVAADMSMMPVMIADFVVGDGMPALPTNDIGYVYQAGAVVTAEQVTALAAALGVAGEPVRTDDGGYVSWQVGPNDGSGPSLYVSQDAQLSWGYSGPWDDRAISTGCAVAVDSAGNTTEECPEPTPPTGVPTAAEAERRAGDLLVALGLDPASYEFETYADEWFASVTAIDKSANGAPIGQANFGFGADGVMQYANGSLATPVEVGPYPLVDLDTAIARLKEQGFWAPYAGGIGIEPLDVAIAVEEPAAAPPAEGVDGSAVPVDTIVPGEVPEPVPGERPYGDPVIVTLVDVQADFWWAWDVDGSVWLLPAYRFIDTDGGWHTVAAVTDEYLIQVPVEEVPAPLPPEEAEVVPPESGTEVEPGLEPPTEPAPFDTAPLESSIGKSLAEFTADAEALGASVRVVEQDGEQLAVTLDYSFYRVNVAVEGDVVVAIVNVG